MKKLCSIVLMLSVISCFAAPDLSKILAGQIDLILEFIATIIPKDLVIVEDGAFDGKKTKMMSEL